MTEPTPATPAPTSAISAEQVSACIPLILQELYALLTVLTVVAQPALAQLTQGQLDAAQPVVNGLMVAASRALGSNRPLQLTDLVAGVAPTAAPWRWHDWRVNGTGEASQPPPKWWSSP